MRWWCGLPCLLALGCQRGCASGSADAGSDAQVQAEAARVTHFPRSLAFSPDGKRLATVGIDEVLVWSMPEGRLEHGFDIKAESVEFSADGLRLLVRELAGVRVLTLEGERISGPVTGMGDADGPIDDTTRLKGLAWAGPNEIVGAFVNGERLSVVDGKPTPRARLAKHKLEWVAWDRGRTRAIVVPDDPQGPHVIASGADFSQQTPFEWSKRDVTVLAVRFSPTGDAFAGLDNRVENGLRVWDATTGAPRPTPTDPKGRLNEFAWSPDGKRIALAAHEAGLHVVSAETGASIAHRDFPSALDDVAWSPDGRSIVVAERGVTLHDANTLQPTARLIDTSDVAVQVACAEKGSFVATLQANGDLMVWDLERGSFQTFGGLGIKPTRLFWVAHDTRFVVGVEGAVLLVDRDSGKVLRRLERKNAIGARESVSPDGKWLAQIEDAPRESGTLPPDLPPVPEFRVPRDGIGLGALPQSGHPHLFLYPLDGGPRRDFGVVSTYGDVELSGDGARVAVVSDRGIEVFDVGSGKAVRRITTPSRKASDESDVDAWGALSPDGHQIVVYGPPGRALQIWNVDEGTSAAVGGRGGTGPIVWSRDGRSLALDGHWRAVPDGKEIAPAARVKLHERSCISADSRWVASPGERDLVLLGRNGHELHLSRVPHGLAWAAFAESADGHFDAEDDTSSRVSMRVAGTVVPARALGNRRRPGLAAAFLAELRDAK